MFEVASRLKYRFNSAVGSLSVEDLWDLPLQSARGVSLDSIAIALNKQIKETAGESFVSTKVQADPTLEARLEIVKHIIQFKMKENEEKRSSAEKKALKDKVAGIIATKQDQALHEMSIDDLKKLVSE